MTNSKMRRFKSSQNLVLKGIEIFAADAWREYKQYSSVSDSA